MSYISSFFVIFLLFSCFPKPSFISEKPSPKTHFLFRSLKIFQSEDDDEVEEGRVYSLACPLSKFESCEEHIDASIDDVVDNELTAKLHDAKKRKQLFANYRFWLNREVPKDVLAIIIRLLSRSLPCIIHYFQSYLGYGISVRLFFRSCGGLVSWENCPAAQYYENDQEITHQVVDRPLLDSHRNLNRYISFFFFHLSPFFVIWSSF